MNKELIKKYKAEFNHFIENTNFFTNRALLVRYYDYADHKYGNWTEIPPTYKWDDDNICQAQFVINDEQVEFRKALAERKTFQHRDDMVDAMAYAFRNRETSNETEFKDTVTDDEGNPYYSIKLASSGSKK